MTNAAPAPRSRRRILLLASLAGGTVASLSLLLGGWGDPFVATAAVVVALVAGFLATWAALVEFREWRLRALADAAAERAEHRESIRALHATQREVLSAVDARTRQLRSSLHGAESSLADTRQSLRVTTADLGEARQQLSRLRGDNAVLRVENTDLRHRLRAATASDGAAVLALPVRSAGGGAGEWETSGAPTVVDLDLQRLTLPLVAEMQARHAN